MCSCAVRIFRVYIIGAVASFISHSKNLFSTRLEWEFGMCSYTTLEIAAYVRVFVSVGSNHRRFELSGHGRHRNLHANLALLHDCAHLAAFDCCGTKFSVAGPVTSIIAASQIAKQISSIMVESPRLFCTQSVPSKLARSSAMTTISPMKMVVYLVTAMHRHAGDTWHKHICRICS